MPASVRRLNRSEIQRLCAHETGLPTAVTDEMAIPTHSHVNPLIRWLFWRRYDLIAELAQFHRNMTVLDFGCGIGVLLPTLCAQTKTVFAVDHFPQYAQLLAEQLSLRVTFSQDMSALPDNSLDLIIAADVLEHVHDLDELLLVFHAKLNGGGRLIVSGPTENLVYKVGRIAAGFAGKGDYHVTNVNRLCAEICASGFMLQRTRNLPFVLPPHLFRIHEFSLKRR